MTLAGCGGCSFAHLIAPGGAVLQPAAVSYSHYHLLVLFNQGIKSFQDGNYNDRLSGMSSGTGSARGDGSDSAPTLTASARDLHPRQAESKCKGTWPEGHGHGQNPRECMEALGAFETWGPAKEDCLSTSPTANTNPQTQPESRAGKAARDALKWQLQSFTVKENVA